MYETIACEAFSFKTIKTLHVHIRGSRCLVSFPLDLEVIHTGAFMDVRLSSTLIRVLMSRCPVPVAEHVRVNYRCPLHNLQLHLTTP